MFPESDITETFKCEALSEKEARMFSPLTLAFLGDAVYSLLVRNMLTSKENKPAGALHRESITLVNAASQAAGVPEKLYTLTGLMPLIGAVIAFVSMYFLYKLNDNAMEEER